MTSRRNAPDDQGRQDEGPQWQETHEPGKPAGADTLEQAKRKGHQPPWPGEAESQPDSARPPR